MTDEIIRQRKAVFLKNINLKMIDKGLKKSAKRGKFVLPVYFDCLLI